MTAMLSAEQKERAKVLAGALSSFPQFCALLDIIDKQGVRQKFRLNPVQKKFNRHRTGRDVVLKARQMGFTTIEQARDIWWFVTKPGTRTIVTCQSDSEHKAQKEISGRYRIMLEGLERAGLALDLRSESATEWVMAGKDSTLKIIEAGASVKAAQKKGRALVINRLHATETAFYEYPEDTFNAMLEGIPNVGSEIVHESTANGADGFFYRLCKNAEANRNGYALHFFPWFETAEYQTPLDPGEVVRPETEREERLVAQGVTPEQLKWYRQKVAGKGEDEKGGQDLVDQEYPSDPETCFLSTGRKFFDQKLTKELIEKAPIKAGETRARDRIRIWKPPHPDKLYIISVDTSEGAGLDPSGAIVADRETGEHVATLDGQYPPDELAIAAGVLGREYNTALIAVERANHGHAVLLGLVHGFEDLKVKPYPNIYLHTDEKLGWDTTSVTRPVMLDALEEAYRKGYFVTKDRPLLEQIKAYIVTDKGRADHPPGGHDELVIAAAIMWQVRQMPMFEWKVGGARGGRGW